jgi:hypothetical protein
MTDCAELLAAACLSNIEQVYVAAYPLEHTAEFLFCGRLNTPCSPSFLGHLHTIEPLYL